MLIQTHFDEMKQVVDEELTSQQMSDTVSKHLYFSRSQILTGFLFFETHSMSLVRVGLDCDPNAQLEVPLPVVLVVIILYDHVLTFGEEVNLAA